MMASANLTPSASGLIARAASLRVDIGSERIWSGVDLSAEPGDTIAVIGPNGAGKSVLLSCLAGAHDPDSGTIEVVNPGVGYLPQADLLPTSLTGREAVAFLGRIDCRLSDRWIDLAETFDIAHALDRPLDSYSIGMRRKLELASVLGTDAALYVLDEPTAGLDPESLPLVREAIADRTADGAAVVYSSHRQDDIDAADRRLLVEEGRVVSAESREVEP
ncbi:ATP-binding cassette domain-containing protein [Halalkalirubrum salinum]|uniref:ATP-binding cassette domain-containing protein n=1 Tax=Halalkalirubrum salinum TaxID=2563889 RepID=UPI0010FAFC3C|nr:ABC transporter ATP-binding protein [Halalkalirubrum salinum]